MKPKRTMLQRVIETCITALVMAAIIYDALCVSAVAAFLWCEVLH